jgi:drug/metabolite transporter (DMT)-like permease
MSSHLAGILFVLCSVCLESAGQLALKTSASRVTGAAFKETLLALGIALFAWEALTWTLALHNIDVSVAYPMSSLSFVVIAICSQILLKEKVTRERWIGIALIILGTVTVGIS